MLLTNGTFPLEVKEEKNEKIFSYRNYFGDSYTDRKIAFLSAVYQKTAAGITKSLSWAFCFSLGTPKEVPYVLQKESLALPFIFYF